MEARCNLGGTSPATVAQRGLAWALTSHRRVKPRKDPDSSALECGG